MKRTWQTCVAVVATLALGTVVSAAFAEGKRGFQLGGGNKIFSQGSPSTRTIPGNIKLGSNLGNSGNSGNNGNSNGPKIGQFKPQILQGLGGLNPSPIVGRVAGQHTKDAVVTKDIQKIPGLGGLLPGPNIPIFNPGTIGGQQPGGGGGQQPGGGGGQQPGGGNGNGNGNGNGGKGGCWFPPIIIGCGPHYGGCYPSYPCYPVGNCYPIYQTQPIVVQQPVVVAAAQAAVTEVKLAEKLLQVPVGSTVTLQAKDLGEKPGQVLLVMEKLTLGTQLNEWKPDQVNLTLPLMGIGEPTKAELVIVKPDGQIATSVKVELIAPAPTGNAAPATAVSR
ncbi:MAG: hypothetical protein SFU86_06420 [Pirellulaceae bacterium]|nr:hypothetical protein [Pirellulaceae bacterium]